MLTRRKTTTHELDETIAKLIENLEGMAVGDEIHTNAVASLKILMETRAAELAAANRPWINPDVIVHSTAHLIGIGLILGFEKANVITSKSLSFVPRIRS